MQHLELDSSKKLALLTLFTLVPHIKGQLKAGRDCRTDSELLAYGYTQDRSQHNVVNR